MERRTLGILVFPLLVASGQARGQPAPLDRSRICAGNALQPAPDILTARLFGELGLKSCAEFHEKAPKLKALSLRSLYAGAVEKDLRLLAHFPNLEELSLAENGLDTLDALPSFPFAPRLKRLDIHNNPVRDLSFLKRLPALQDLDARFVGIKGETLTSSGLPGKAASTPHFTTAEYDLARKNVHDYFAQYWRREEGGSAPEAFTFLFFKKFYAAKVEQYVTFRNPSLESMIKDAKSYFKKWDKEVHYQAEMLGEEVEGDHLTFRLKVNISLEGERSGHPAFRNEDALRESAREARHVSVETFLTFNPEGKITAYREGRLLAPVGFRAKAPVGLHSQLKDLADQDLCSTLREEHSIPEMKYPRAEHMIPKGTVLDDGGSIFTYAPSENVEARIARVKYQGSLYYSPLSCTLPIHFTAKDGTTEDEPSGFRELEFFEIFYL